MPAHGTGVDEVAGGADGVVFGWPFTLVMAAPDTSKPARPQVSDS